MKLVNLKTMKSKNLSEYEAFKLINETPEEEKLKPGKHELLRTNEFILYVRNKKDKTKLKPYVRRLSALLAKQTGELVHLNEKNYTIIAGGIKYVLADRISSQEELEYHQAKGGEVICLKKSSFCKYLFLDNKTIKDYYNDVFEFPKWFSLKQRSVRSKLMHGGFAFNSRRYNDTSKSTRTMKFKKDFANLPNDKIFYCISRNLDTRLERWGLGFALQIYYVVFDLDGNCGQIEHLIDDTGFCVNCLEDATRKVEKAKEILKYLPEFKDGIRILLSGGRGFQIMPYNEIGKPMIECNEQRYLQIQSLLNANEELVDDFTRIDQEGNRRMDATRIMKLPASIASESACIIKELPITRLDVQDKIIEVENEKENNNN